MYLNKAVAVFPTSTGQSNISEGRVVRSQHGKIFPVSFINIITIMFSNKLFSSGILLQERCSRINYHNEIPTSHTKRSNPLDSSKKFLVTPLNILLHYYQRNKINVGAQLLRIQIPT